MISLTSTSYSQNFNSLASSGSSIAWSNDSTLPGWSLFNKSGSALSTYAAGIGTSNAGAFYSFGSTADDRALGGVGSGGSYFGSPSGGSVAGWIAVALTNDTGASIDTVTIAYDGEQWRNGGNTTAQTMVFEYGFGATFASVSTWTAAGGDFDWASPVATSSAGAIDGNVAGLVADRGGELDTLDWNVSETLWLRWTERNDAGNDHGLAIDDFVLSVVPAATGDMQITEFMYTGSDDEFIEFTNVGAAPVDMTGWSFDDNSRTAGTVDLSAFGLVQPGESVILSEADATDFRSTWSLADGVKVIGGLTANLGRNDEINLYDAADALIDRLTFGDEDFPGTVRAQSSSAWAYADQLAEQSIDTDWRLSSAGDGQGSRLSSGGDTGSPGSYQGNFVAAPGITLVESNGTTSVAEGGASDSYTLVLDSQPSADVTIALNAGAQLTTSGNLVFTQANWNVPQTVTVSAVDDAVVEGNHAGSINHAVSSADAGYDGLAVTDVAVAIEDNEQAFLTRIASATSNTASEIPAFDPGSGRVYVVALSKLDVYRMAADGSLTALASITEPGFAVADGQVAAPNSVAIKNGVVAVAYEIKDSASGAHAQGKVSFFNAADGSFLNAVEVGALPDMLTFTPDGGKVLVANEGEPNSYGQADSLDPEGSVSIIDLSNGVLNASVATAGFSAFNDQQAALQAAGVRIFGPNASVAQDLEPEYIAVTPDGATALVTLQENNALAKVDIASATVLEILPLGVKDFSLAGNGLDASDRDSAIHIQTQPVVGLYQPDAIASFSVGGQIYSITANEGDARDYTGFSEEIRVGSGTYDLDDTLFPNEATLKQNANLGRLNVTRFSGDTNDDGDFDQIVAFGARSFSIRDADGNLVYDSGDDLEQLTATLAPTLFNSDGDAGSFDSRSDNKGPEPEGVAIGEVNGHIYAFIGLERIGDIVVYDVTTPSAPRFVQYFNTPEDLAPEGLTFVAAADSPTGTPLLISANEASNTVAVFEIAAPLRIADIQGTSHISPYNGQGVQDIQGIVTAIASNGFYLQDPLHDNNDATSEGIFVFTTNAAILGARSIGEAVMVSGTVSEYRPGGNANNLTITEIVNNNNVQALSVTAWTDAPAGGIAALTLGVDRLMPNATINDDFASQGNVETGGDFDPVNEGIDFWESLEGMLVGIADPVATSPTANFGASEEIWVLANAGAGASSVTARGGSLIQPHDFNPERIQIDDLNNNQVLPDVDVGARLSDVVGVVNYDYNNYEVLTLAAPSVEQASPLQKEVTALVGGTNQLTVATFNVENLDPSDGVAKFDALAQAIVNNLMAPDILNLEEVQDNNGATNNGVVAADVTLQTLIDAIAAAGGPTYAYRQINPVDGQDGGEPGGNIRVAFLYNPDRVDFVEGSLQRLTDSNLADGDAFASSRKPLAGTFTFNGEDITVIGNHFNSKGGDQPLFGPNQPPELASETQRMQQAEIVKAFVENLGADAKVIVAGDLNDFEFSNPLTLLEGAGLNTLIETLPANERYTYNYQGNAQTLDHLLASDALLAKLDGFDAVHINSEFAEQVSDHDPVIARFALYEGQTHVGGNGRDILVGGKGDDTLAGLLGRDMLTGGDGADTFVYTRLLDLGDVITDFQPGVDQLDIAPLMASIGRGGVDPLAEGYLGVKTLAGRTYATFDSDGNAGHGAPRLLAELVGVSDLHANDLIL